MTGKLMSLCLLQTFFQRSLSLTDPSPVVSVRNGTLRGASMTVKGSNKQVQQYLGIPFARPPLGPLRLSAPQPAESWEGERDATQQPPMCPQPLAFVTHIAKVMAYKFALPGVSEDCLYLNVYTPTTNSCTGEKLPVLVWMHGGALYLGGAAQFDGSVLAAYQNVVVVIIQYRLGILGYFSTGDTNAQENWGFLDQIAALQWVRENIESFGGDPNSVTIAGQSAGGISASMLEAGADEYFKDAHTPQEMRDQFTEIVGDYWMVVPVIKEARYYLDAGVSVYMYEFQHRPEAYEYTRPSFVRADHSDELMFIFGACFWDGHIKVTGKITEEENRLCNTMMAYWANFMRTGSPNGPGLVHWPLYDASNKYLNLDLQQSEGQDLKKDRVQFFKKLAAKKTQLQEQ
ncbi:carboxylesterase 5A-like [Alosa pseudoharengus]|uniref:carboxylesterase 5A-like n=1 Tax=Alosa pseudoharengus TaxID=34774 RepID=UPI003F8C00A7